MLRQVCRRKRRPEQKPPCTTHHATTIGRATVIELNTAMKPRRCSVSPAAKYRAGVLEVDYSSSASRFR
jgi:hypothetical protein